MGAERGNADGIKLFLQNKEIEGVDKIMVFGKQANSVHLDPKDADHPNIQPLILIEEGEGSNAVPKCLVFIDGEFPGLESNTADEGRPYLFCGQYLNPKIQEKWEDSGADVAKFLEKIKRTVFQTDIENYDKEIAVAVLCPGDGGFVYFAARDSHDYPWGFTNDTCGWEDKVPTSGSPSSTVTPGKRGRLTSLMTSVAPAASDAVVDNTSSVILYEGQLPANIIKNNDIRAAYKKYHGRDEPPGWKNGKPWVSILPNMVDNARQQGWNIRTSKHLAAQAPISPSGTEAPPQILTDVMKDKLLKFVSAIDANTQQVVSPEEMEKNETASPTFWDDTGMTLETGVKVFGGKEEHRTTLIKENPTATSKLIRDLCYALFRQDAAIEALTEPTPKAPAEPAVAVTPAKKFSMR